MLHYICKLKALEVIMAIEVKFFDTEYGGMVSAASEGVQEALVSFLEGDEVLAEAVIKHLNKPKKAKKSED